MYIQQHTWCPSIDGLREVLKFKVMNGLNVLVDTEFTYRIRGNILFITSNYKLRNRKQINLFGSYYNNMINYEVN